MNSEERKSVLKWMSEVTGTSKIRIALLTVTEIALGLCSVLFALFLRDCVNNAVSGNGEAFRSSVIGLILLVLVQIALAALSRFLEEYCRSTIENQFKKRLFGVLLKKDYASVTDTHSGEWMNRLTSDTSVAANHLTQIVPGFCGMVVKIIGALAALFWMEPKFMYFLLPGGALLLIFSTVFRKQLKCLHKKIQESDGRLRIFLSERLSNLIVLHSFRQEQSTEDQADVLMQEHRKARMNRLHFSNVCRIGFSLIIQGIYILGVIFCGMGILKGSMDYGNLVGIMHLIGQIEGPFANISAYIPRYYALLASAERLMEAESFADDAADEPIADAAAFYHDSLKSIELRDVSFSYPGEERDETVLSHFSLKINKGDFVAFAGKSGIGKSTVLKLLMALYPLQEGNRILHTEQGETELTGAYRSLFAYVPQGNLLMAGTIREVITFNSDQNADDEKIREALRISCADEFVSALSDGIDTKLKERGSGLSEGQMQRIAIARAVWSGHPILLLDEATSALDQQTEAELLENLRQMTDRTVIIVTHRTKALELCDQVIAFESETGEMQ